MSLRVLQHLGYTFNTEDLGASNVGTTKKFNHICLGLKGVSLVHLLNVVGDAKMGCTFEFLYGPFLKWFELDISNSGDGEFFLLLFEC